MDGPARYRWQATLRNEGTLLDVLKHLSRGSSDRQHSQERCLWSDRAVRDVQEAREGHRAKGAHCADGPEGGHCQRVRATPPTPGPLAAAGRN